MFVPRATTLLSASFVLLSSLSSLTTNVAHAKAILGVDMGSLYMKVALVQRGAPLEIVTNMHSKRKTEVMVLFDNGSRFYGADAFSLLGRKPHLTPTALGTMLGRSADHPVIKALSERHSPLVPAYNATRHGPTVTVAGASYTPEELVAMVLQHSRDITKAYSDNVGAVKDCVLTVPSFYTQHERLALMDAAELSGLNVLGLIDENTASALNFGMDRVDEEPKNYLFYNLGAGALQVSVVKYHSYETKQYGKTKTVGSFEVKGKGWDTTLGGTAFDAILVDHMADEFNAIWNKQRNDGETKDVRDYPRPMSKLRLQAVKAKQVLSANTEIPVFMDSLHDDVSYSTTLTRAKLEEMSTDLLKRTTVPIEEALKAANMTLDDIDAVELIGGGMRVPKVQEVLREFLGEKAELGMHINSDESMALGAAFRGANVSTAFKVRQIGMTDRSPFALAVTLTDMPIVDEENDEGEGEEKKGGGGIGGLFGIGKKKKEDKGDDNDKDEKKDDEGTEPTEPAEPWKKEATIFKANSKVGIKKTIAFTHDVDIECALDYADETDDRLPEGTERSLGSYSITGVKKFAADMEKKGLGKPKVSLQFELDASGLTGITKAEAVVEEMVTVTEEIEVEVDVEEGEEGEEGAAADAAEGETKEEEPAADSTADTDTKEEEKKEDGTEAKETTDAEAADDKKDGETASSEEKKETDEKEEGEKAEGETETKEEEKEKEPEKPKKKKIKKTVEKEKKKLHKRVLQISLTHSTNIRPYSESVMAESKAKLQLLDDRDRERLLLESSKNKLESYVYKIKNALVDDEENIGKVTTEEQREALSKSAAETEDWMYEDGYDADLAAYEARYEGLSTPAEAVFFRVSENVKRPEAVEALGTKLDKVVTLMEKWEAEKPQITKEERDEVLELVEEERTWLKEAVEKQESTPAHETPAFTSEEVPLRTRRIETLVGKLSKRPKPKPVEKKNETESSEGDETSATEEDGAEKKEGDDAEEEKKTTGEEEGETSSEEEKKDDAPKEEAKDEAKEGEEEKKIEDEL